jgi:hypothetical protein
MVDVVTGLFIEALRDYFFLLNRSYPEKATIKLVGDKYRLNGLQRLTLYRGITSRERAKERKKKITADLKAKMVYIDGYNVLFTIMNYLFGKFIFIANDGLLRDCGEVYGKVKNETLFYKAVDIFFDYIGTRTPAGFEIYFDSPVSKNELHVSAVKKKMSQAELKGKVLSVKSVDHELKEKNAGLLATSDSEIIDAAACRIIDLGRGILEKNFGIEILDLATLLRTEKI